MIRLLYFKLFGVIAVLVGITVLFRVMVNPKPVDFSADVKPLINKKCISCHGGVKKEGGFSLLFEHEAKDTTASGVYAIVPGKPAQSELIKRLHATNPEERMPYHEQPLSKEEIDVLTRWVKEGAVWGEHWAYVPVAEPAIPKGKEEIQPVDRFIQAALKKQQLQPAGVADKATLLRRVSLDITGLPPSTILANAFLEDKISYEALIDALLNEDSYGEKWTSMWLDIARYADTKGYEKDDFRSIWRYRDWLISSFNKDMPYNQFITEQLAGDLLDNPTNDQLIATAFNRNTSTNDEGGTDNEEFRTSAVLDRVNTTWEALMSTTFACVQCHSHPYDPFTHEDYYTFTAFFNNTRDEDTVDDYPLLREYNETDKQKLNEVSNWMLQNADKKTQKEKIAFLKTWQPSFNSYTFDIVEQCEITQSRWMALRNNAITRISPMDVKGKNVLVMRYRSFMDGGIFTIKVNDKEGPVVHQSRFNNTNGWQIGHFPLNIPDSIKNASFFISFSNSAFPATGMDYLVYLDWLHFTDPFPGLGRPGYDSIYQYYTTLLHTVPEAITPIMMENPDYLFRPTHFFERGSWLAKGDEMKPGVPASLNKWPDGAPANRLGLAQWITSNENPLTSRTIVNRIWEQLMGQGIVETLEDMGTQSIEPTHPELLDWLSWQLMNKYEWSLKTLIKTILLSHTYKQESNIDFAYAEIDPFNKYYARGPRVRLTAEQIRDQSLSVSGLLSDKMYGPAVMPYQPDGIWNAPYEGLKWKQSEGEDQYRRALYTFWRRSAPYPGMLSFDGSARDVCQARRIRTNTPLQALVTLNDRTYIEMAKELAKKMMLEKSSLDERIQTGYTSLMFKPLQMEKLNILRDLYTKALQAYKEKPDNNELSGAETAEIAAMTLVANAILNLDEVLTKN